MQNVQSNTLCVQDKIANGKPESDCMFAEELIKYIDTPFLFVNSK